MSLAEEIELPAPPPEQPSHARTAVLKRLADVVCLPSSRVNAFERSMTADLIVEVMRGAAAAERARVARRLASVAEIPNPLCRLMLRDAIEVASPLLELNGGLREDDLLDCIRMAALEHRRLIAARRGLGEILSDALAEHGEAVVLEVLLRNNSARLGQAALDAIVAMGPDHPALLPLLARRPELRPAQAYAIFWWADSELRNLILRRFAVSREVLQDAVSDIFALAAQEGWEDEPARKALQFIERRQRNRSALARSGFDSLEAAVAAAGGGGELTGELSDEIGYLSGIKPVTAAKIFTDSGGEAIAVLCKATGLPRSAILALWRGLRRPETLADGQAHPRLARVMEAYDIMAVDRAQTILRYWNWSASPSTAGFGRQSLKDKDEGAAEDYGRGQSASILALAQEMGR